MRIYGHFKGQSSLVRVSKGFASVFPEAHLYDFDDWLNDLDDSSKPVGGATDAVALFVGNLSHLPEAWLGMHKEMWVMVAPNSNMIGPDLQGLLKSVDHLMGPSEWACEVLRSFFPDKIVKCVPHGVSEQFKAPEEREKFVGYRALHMSSSVMERKGTDVLLEAWAQAEVPSDSILYISVPRGKTLDFLDLAEDLKIRDSVKISDRLDLEEDRMSRLYASMDLVIQPSRGEGFGLVPLEARACGTPVLMTDSTGHSQHAGGPGCSIIPTGALAPIDDFPGAMAPSLSVRDVAECLRRAYSERTRLSAEAIQASAEIRKKWSWESQLKEFKDDIIGSVQK